MIELSCKPGVTPMILWIAAAVTRLALPVRRITIAAGTNGTHMAGSLHPQGRALDLRTKDFPSDAAKYDAVRQLRHALGPDYDVILEALGTDHEHLHVEYDPKAARL